MIEKKQTVTKQKLVTVVTANYVELFVPDLLEKIFDIYNKRDFTKRNFQLSVHENTYSTSAIVLSVLGIEAYRNRIYYLEKKKVGKSVPSDISTMFAKKDSNFPKQYFEDILSEVFVIRDVIVHNHIYEVVVVSDDNWDMVSHRQKLLEGYGDNQKYHNFVNNRTRKTKNLGLNVQPGKIGFEDLFKVLIVLDLFVGISTKLFTNNYVPFRFTREINGKWEDKLSIYLAQFYNQIPNKRYKLSLKTLLNSFEAKLGNFILDSWDYFIHNKCPKCKEYGFHQPNHVTKCNTCGFEIKLVHH
ncbi:hypothetical protein A2130_00315 [Candidatus Woesebacteria bacterium GWC2_33_12]|uniref:Uncharacterized protein n=1 Tax=Candidatus Woesebacteria bacterium GW2011_GWB1_33_22 TaxID=1618566 RepID=A0A0G0CMY3_9BACT|nr:MAG: hypothetical protein UR29_C0008G0012 [Candidatus Woesebacteria bacterium GW2011_GWC2_33_12]KKP42078.1 MAG: hypothetical protein UR33_C0006G0062 [Candidatus Woesebacteria bacterium GW2011_GWA2_33_20]KKP44772.1 MAG: hypothetical protein UR35_C0006G0007 [Candidatus Woesebacteria bacterium GW2011_GWB1_33_22]KKP46591.1 MAG: hypothetical protein UR37_C0006G0041 [Microgenomates group bacterium GW2011_GWC1_33_28]KKP50504.1 MAG: hypothetical protein UR41_C0006G0007 [Candidatus Woesebacteria bact